MTVQLSDLFLVGAGLSFGVAAFHSTTLFAAIGTAKPPMAVLCQVSAITGATTLAWVSAFAPSSGVGPRGFGLLVAAIIAGLHLPALAGRARQE